MTTAEARNLISTDWLAAHLHDPKLRILDASWHMPDSGRDSRADYERGHIPGALFFDIDAVSDPDSAFPHMLPQAEIFARAAGDLGIDGATFVVAYDTGGLHAAARAWWMFRAFGHDAVAVLNGGLPKWMAEGRPVTDDSSVVRKAEFHARLRAAVVADAAQVAASIEDPAEQIVDARGAPRFTGREAEPRPGLRSGHIPTSRNLHYDRLYAANGTLKAPEILRALFEEAGVDLSRPAIVSCGSGITACSLALALQVLGHRDWAVYDGSWAEWGGRSDLPVATGEA